LPYAKKCMANTKYNDPEESKGSNCAGLFFSLAAVLGIGISFAALIIWPLCCIENWPAGGLTTAMLVVGFLLIFAGMHYFDRCDARRGR
jgi:hypothetical protein